MAVAGAKLALLLIPILGVAGDGYSSLQENYYGSDNHEHPKKWDTSFKNGLVVEEKEQGDDEDTNDGISDGKGREEENRSQRAVKHRRKTLPWPLRLKIAVGVARGLARLHHDCWGQVVHLNISSKCILLDRDFEPKISNFGKAMLMRMTSASGVLKEDVHAFGVVLLELITGMDCSRMDFSSNSILNEWIFRHLLSASYFHDAMDRFLIGQGFDDEIFQLLKVACNCLDCIPDRRPTMIQVYRDIKTIMERCEVVDGSEIQTQPEIRSATSQDHKQDQ
ncbi:hypothetical protein DKX38_026403 [Salix brachista]|uniref:Protein kinase domain-containing protein n=1 Tax=Salix brachista TaxID=2182728 RepID=A0A5N5JEI1_9ROSI|nr:hypothetical protein DKX38_026403 [Salix brachista]